MIRPALFALILSVTMLPGCANKLDIKQGNQISQETVEKLREGMTKAQVRYVIGTPLLVDPFQKNQWDYVYYTKHDGLDPVKRHLTLKFNGDNLVSIIPHDLD